MSIDIVITDIYSAQAMLKEKPNFYRLLSIFSTHPVTEGETKIKLEGSKEMLSLQFDDMTDELARLLPEKEYQLATEEDCLKSLDFLKQGGPCLVHCMAGVSRSPAIVFGYLLSLYEDYHHAVEKLFEIRKSAEPNSYIVQLMCRILGREPEFKAIIEYSNFIRKRPYIMAASSKEKVLKAYFKK